MSDDRIRVVVADDQTVVREGVRALLALQPDMCVVAAVDSAEAAVDAVERLHPDVLLTDLGMPGIGGIEGIRQVRARHPGTRVVALTALTDARTTRDAVTAGALGFLDKFAEPDVVADAVRAAAAGRALLDEHALASLLEAPTVSDHDDLTLQRPHGADSGLTPRELDVLRLVASGMSNQQVGRALFVSLATVKTHMNHLLTKTGCSGRADLVRYAFDRRLVD